jgi:putative ABC transport system permease protein
VDHGITVLMVTHEPDMAAYARRMVRFVDGHIASDEPNPHPALWPRCCRGESLMLFNTLLLALRSIRRNLLRSFLTILGIVIGVSAVITMVTLGNGATQAVQTQIASLGTNLLMVRPVNARGRAAAAGRCRSSPRPMPNAIRAQIGGVAAGGAGRPRQRHRRGQRPQLGHQRHGSTNDWFETGNWKLASGACSSDEQRAGAAVCIIGETVRREIFGGAVGQTGWASSLRIKQFSCT